MEQNVNNNGKRVNKITVSLDGDGARVSLYRTNTRLGEVYNTDISVPPFSESKLPNKQVYLEYCRETVTNLLKNDGIPGYYYDPSNHAVNSGLPKKFDKSLLVVHGKTMVGNTVGDIVDNIDDMQYNIAENEDMISKVSVSELYKDGYIKYGNVDFDVKLTYKSADKNIIVPVNIKSGQLCKSKVMMVDGIQKNINPTNILGLFGDTKPVVQVQATSKDTTPVEHNEVDDTKIPVYNADDDIVATIGPDSDTQDEVSATIENKEDDISDMMDKFTTGKLSSDDIAKLRDAVNNKRATSDNTAKNVSNIMNVLKGDRK